jgi:hypothetical protein
MVIKSIKALYKMLSSRAFLLWIIGFWISYYVISAIWQKEAFGALVGSLGDNVFMQVAYVLFLISGIFNIIRASTQVLKESRAGFLFWLVLPVGLILFFTGFLMSSTMRESGQRFVGEGNVIDPPWTTERYRVTGIEPGLKDSLAANDVSSGIFAYEPKLRVMDSSSQGLKIGAFPPSKFGNTYYHILNFGIAPGVILSEGSTIRSEGHMILRIITPGSSDFFEIEPYPYKFLVSMESEKTVHHGQEVPSEFKLKTPRFHVRVFSEERVIAEGDPARGIEVDSLKLTFFRPTYWVQLEAVKDPGISVMHMGIILVTFGIPFSLFRFVILSIRK